jgi:hypothetical protein
MDSTAIQTERERRFAMWSVLKQAGGPSGLSPSVIKETGVHRGQQGVFRDQRTTASLTPEGTGVTVGLLHTGTSYADDMTTDGVIYHYPVTNRPGPRDRNEVSATKLCGELGLPLFVVETPERTPTVRDVHIGWTQPRKRHRREDMPNGAVPPTPGTEVMPSSTVRVTDYARPRHRSARTQAKAGDRTKKSASLRHFKQKPPTSATLPPRMTAESRHLPSKHGALIAFRDAVALEPSAP